MMRLDPKPRLRRGGRLAWAMSAAALLAVAVPAGAQSLAQRVSAASGTVELQFAARDGVCGDGEESLSFHSFTMMRSMTFSSRDGEWRHWCQPGPVRVVLTVHGGAVEAIHTHVGNPRVAATDVTRLGTVPAREAADYFLSLAKHSADAVGREAILPAALADSVTIWPSLLELAQDRGRPVETRKRALFWAGQLGDTQVRDPVTAIARSSSEERALREHAVFVLSQLSDGAGVPTLVALAHASGEPWLAKKATFWLGQTDEREAHQALRDLVVQPGTDDEVKGEAIFVLGQHDDDDDQAFLRAQFDKLPSSRLQDRVLMGVGQHGGAAGGQWLFDVALDSSRSMDVRKHALFWAGQGDVPTARLAELYPRLHGRELKEHLLFVLSQRDDSLATATLMNVAQTDPSHEARKRAMFWLGQKHDPRVTAFLTRILERE
jgi:hypothetical protein